MSDTLSDSDTGVVSDHTIQFTLPSDTTGIDATGEQIIVSFPAGFNLGSVAFGDVDLVVDSVEQTLAAAASGGTWGATVSGQDLILETDTATVASSTTVEIQIGTNASGGTNQITNPGTPGSYEIIITLPEDSGTTEVVILDDVVVTATVDTIFDFTVAGFASTGIDINGTSTTATSSATALPFGTLTAGSPETVGQLLNVSTNASNGFVVTVQQSGDLLSATGADIDGFIDGAYTDSPASWQSPAGTLGSENTYGHWGLTSSDDLNGDEFGSNLWVAASTTPRQIFAHDGPADGTTANAGSTTVAYQVEITTLQEAGDDYTTTLTYVATPVF
jgi:hypothetical protein